LTTRAENISCSQEVPGNPRIIPGFVCYLLTKVLFIGYLKTFEHTEQDKTGIVRTLILPTGKNRKSQDFYFQICPEDRNYQDFIYSEVL
jgi:hypothetical protein